MAIAFQKPSEYEAFGGASQWSLQSDGSAGTWRHAGGWCEKAVPVLPTTGAEMEKKAVPVLPMSRAEMEKAIEELEAKLEASYEIKFRDLQASQEKTLHALTRKQEVLEAVKLGLAEKVLGTHQYLMTTKPLAALALSPPLAQARNVSLLAPALPSLEDRPTPVAAEQQSLKPPCMHQKGSVLSMPLTQMGTRENDLESWTSHLDSTLFSGCAQKSNAFFFAMRNCWSSMEATACRTKANRFYYVRCKHCEEYVHGEYGHTAGEHKNDAQNKLLQFVGAAAKDGQTETIAQQELPQV